MSGIVAGDTKEPKYHTFVIRPHIRRNPRSPTIHPNIGLFIFQFGITAPATLLTIQGRTHSSTFSTSTRLSSLTERSLYAPRNQWRLLQKSPVPLQQPLQGQEVHSGEEIEVEEVKVRPGDLKRGVIRLRASTEGGVDAAGVKEGEAAIIEVGKTIKEIGSQTGTQRNQPRHFLHHLSQVRAPPVSA